MMLIIKNLFKSINSESILKDINLTINTGEIFILYGKNGAGKTTLIRCIAGLLDNDKGEIFSKNINKTDYGLVIGDSMLLNSLTIKEYLHFICDLKKLNKNTRNIKIRTLINNLSLNNYKNKLISKLSRGNKSKLSLAASLIYSPKLLLLDEPFTGMDLIGIKESIKLLKDISNKGTIIILSTHNSDAIKSFNGTLALLNNKTLKIIKKGNLGNIENIKLEEYLK